MQKAKQGQTMPRKHHVPRDTVPMEHYAPEILCPRNTVPLEHNASEIHGRLAQYCSFVWLLKPVALFFPTPFTFFFDTTSVLFSTTMQFCETCS